MHYALTAEDRTELQDPRDVTRGRLRPIFSSFSRASLLFSWSERVRLVMVLPAYQQRLIDLVQLHAEAAAAGRLIKFVPASGAASRMFQILLSFSRQPELLSNSGFGQESGRGRC